MTAATAAVFLGLPLLADATPATDGNPDLPSTCGLDVTLVLDDSASLDTGEANDVRAAADRFATALTGTPSRIKVVTFDTRATGVNSGGTATSTLNNVVFRNPSLYTAPTAGAGQGGTNWDDGLEVARRSNGGPGKLVVFITDGDPTYRNETEPDGHLDAGNHNIEGPGNTVEQANVDAAEDEADAIKAAGAHMFGIGIGLTAAASETRLSTVTGDEELTVGPGGVPNIPFGTADYTIAPDFDDLEAVIRAFVRDLCAPSVNVTKFLQNANGTTTKATGATPWTFNATVSPTPASWSDPGGASGASASQPTDANGGASFAWEPGANDNNFSVDLSEDAQAGWVYNGAKCTLNNLDGADPTVIFDNVGTNAAGQSGNQAELQNLSLNLNQAVSCEVYNRQIRTSTIQVAKLTDPAGRPETFDFTLRNDNVPIDTVDDIGHGQTGTFDPVGPGTYDVTEAAVPGFTQTAATCDNLGTTPVETESPVGLVVGEGQNWKCTFTNTAAPGTVTVVKNTVEADGTFDFTSDIPDLGNFALSTTAGTASTATVAVPPGTYHLNETDPAPWTLSGATCTGQQTPGTFSVDPGQDVTCTFTNTAPDPTINVTKIAVTPVIAEGVGQADYSVTVTNTSVEDVTITSITDAIDGGSAVDLTTTSASILATTCNTLVGTVLTPTGPGASASCTFTAKVPGDAGDTVNDIVVVNADDGEQNTATDSDDADVSITDVAPTIQVTKSADVASIAEPGGSITYTVGVTNTSVEDVTITALTDSIEGGSAFSITSVSPPVTATTCNTLIGTTLAPAGAANCTFTVSQPADRSELDDDDIDDTVTVSVTDDDDNTINGTASAEVAVTDTLPTITVSKTPSPSSVAETGPGASHPVTYTVGITNTSGEAVTIDSILDSVEGGPNGAVGGTCATLLGTTLAAGDSTSCTFTKDVSGNEGDVIDDVVTVNASDDDDNSTSGTADASVTVTGLASSIDVTKTADTGSVPEPGAPVTYTIGIQNTSVTDSVTLSSITDVVEGGAPFAAAGTCPALIGTVLAPGASTSCSFTLPVNGNAGDSIDDTITVNGTDDDGDPVSDSADESVAVTDVAPSIAVTKSPSVSSVTEPGGPVTYTVGIQNTSAADPVTIDSINDVVSGGSPFAAGGTCPALLGTTLAAGASTSCAFTLDVNGNAGDSVPDTVTVTGHDDDAHDVSANAGAIVDVTDANPTLSITKTPSVSSVPEPGAPVTFTVGIENTSDSDTVTLTAITDSVDGGAPFAAGGTCPALIGDALEPGQTTECAFTLDVNGNGGDVVPDTVTVTGTDEDPVPGAPTTVSFGGAGGAAAKPGLKVAPHRTASKGGGSGEDSTTNGVVSAQASAAVSVVDTLPTGTVSKDADPGSVPEPGGPVDFDVTVTNTSPNENVTVTAITDTVDGTPIDVTTVGGLVTATDCATGSVLVPGGTYTCTFTLQVSGDAGDIVVDVISVTLQDDDDNTVTPTDTETVAVTDVLPTISVVKDNGGAELDAPGGDVDFDVTVTNNSVESVTLTSLTDSIEGGAPFSITAVAGSVTATTCATGGSIAPGASYDCTFTRTVTSNEAKDEADTVDAAAVDNEGNPATAGDGAVTKITASADLEVDKTVDGDLQAGETGHYDLEVTNNGPSTAVDVTVIDQVPAGLTATSASGDGWACVIAGQTITCERPTMASGDSSTIGVDVDVALSAAGEEVTNVVDVGSATADPDPGNNHDEVVSLVADAEPQNEERPTTTTTTAPPSNPPAVTPGNLARTGSPVDRMVLLGLGLVTFGFAALLTRRVRIRQT